MHIRLIDHTKLTLGISVSVHGCFSFCLGDGLAIDWQSVQDVPCLLSNGSWDRLQPPACTLCRNCTLFLTCICKDPYCLPGTGTGLVIVGAHSQPQFSSILTNSPQNLTSFFKDLRDYFSPRSVVFPLSSG